MFSRVMIVLIVIVLCFFFCIPAQAQEAVYFADANLKAAVEDALWVDDPTPPDMLELRELYCIRQGVKDITGLEHAKNVELLWLRWNDISDLSPLSGLSNVHTLSLSMNRVISDLTPLSGLANLQHLDLHANNISDLAPLSALQQLDTLVLRKNEVSDVGPLSALTNLRVLNLMHNWVRDASPLASMTGLETLGLHFNPLSDLTGLSELHNLKDLDLEYNPIQDLTPILSLTNLEYLDIRLIDLPNELYCSQIQTILENNPDVWLGCDANLNAPDNVVASSGTYADRIIITWDTVCSLPEYTSYYRVYRSLSQTGARVALGSWQTATQFTDLTAEPGVQHIYWVQTSISESDVSAGPYSEPVTGWMDSKHTLHVDANALPDPNGIGTASHPLNSIQEAIDVAPDGTRIVVHPGIYYEQIVCEGKSLRIEGAGVHSLEPIDFPIIDGNGVGPVIQFLDGTDVRGMAIVHPTYLYSGLSVGTG